MTDHSADALMIFGIEEQIFERLAARLSYVSGDFGDDQTYKHVADALGGAHGAVFYLEIPPSLFSTVVAGLAKAGLAGDGRRVVVEKPFGHDLASARELAAQLHKYIDESQLYRIDHGVPFFIRTGKQLPVTRTELRLVFKHPPKLHFISVDRRSPAPSQIVLKLDPSTGIRMILDAHRSDHAGPAEIQLDMEFAQEGGEGATPYEVLLHAALIGDSTYFTRRTASRRAGGSSSHC